MRLRQHHGGRLDCPPAARRQGRQGLHREVLGAQIQVQGGGSGTGLTQVSQGAVQIGNSDVTAESKLPSPDAQALVDHVVTKQGWIMVVSPDVTGITSLTSAQATDIWTAKVTNWKDVGGPDEPIVLVLRPESSGT